jgi:hypothetical protein
MACLMVAMPAKVIKEMRMVNASTSVRTCQWLYHMLWINITNPTASHRSGAGRPTPWNSRPEAEGHHIRVIYSMSYNHSRSIIMLIWYASVPYFPQSVGNICSPLDVFMESSFYLCVLFVCTERGLGRSCDVSNATTDGARKAYARGPWSERHSSREESGGRSSRSHLMYFVPLVDREYRA